ncbi:MAG: hypothetical protein Q4B72_05455 [Lachnospiraceae bacterium]|nr:hypothetical protein [Lachnospiraceae bacterium]
MKRVLKLVLPPVLAILLVVGYGSGTIQTIAKTITTQTHITTETEVTLTSDSPIDGYIHAGTIFNEYWWTVTKSSTGYDTETQVDVPDDNEISDQTVPDEKPDEEPHEVPQTPENNYGLFQDKISNMIADIEKKTQTDSTVANPSSDPIVLDTGNWVSFKGDVYQKLQDSGRPIQITFRYKGKNYRVDIPADADLMSLVDENGYCGFMNLMAHFGGTELEK